MKPRRGIVVFFISSLLYAVVLILYHISLPFPTRIVWSLAKYFDKLSNEPASAKPEKPTAPLLDFQDLGSSKTKVLLLVIVNTAAQRFDRRQAIRETWWKHCVGDQAKCVFTTDGLLEDQNKSTLILEERIKYADMELLALPQGVLFGFRFLHQIKWAKAKFNFRFLLRIDDDYFLCLKRLLSELPARLNTSLAWGHFHCEVGITWLDEGFMIFTQDMIYTFLAQNESAMLCHPMGDQQIALWLETISNKPIYFHDSRLHHDPPASYSEKFENISNVCDLYLGIHGTYPTKMRSFGRNANDGAKSVVPIGNFSHYCKWTHFDYRKMGPKYFFEPKPCITNQTWNVTRKIFAGRQN